MKVTVLRREADGVEEVAEVDKASASAGFSTRAERAWLPRTQEEWTAALAVGERPDKPREHCAVRPEHPSGDSQLSWSAEFDLNDDPLKPRTAGTKYSVLVEEVQPMLPASYADEPIEDVVHADKDRQELTWSGPRFAALVALTGEDKGRGGNSAESNIPLPPLQSRNPKPSPVGSPSQEPHFEVRRESPVALRPSRPTRRTHGRASHL
jgi:hypothetical protein